MCKQRKCFISVFTLFKLCTIFDATFLWPDNLLTTGRGWFWPSTPSYTFERFNLRRSYLPGHPQQENDHRTAPPWGSLAFQSHWKTEKCKDSQQLPEMFNCPWTNMLPGQEGSSYLCSSACIWKASSSQSSSLWVNSLTSCCEVQHQHVVMCIHIHDVWLLFTTLINSRWNWGQHWPNAASVEGLTQQLAEHLCRCHTHLPAGIEVVVTLVPAGTHWTWRHPWESLQL